MSTRIQIRVGLNFYYDPGVQRHACAWFLDQRLIDVHWLDAAALWTAPYLPARAAFERMHFTHNDASDDDARGGLARRNDVMDTRAAADRLAGRLEQAGAAPPIEYRPAEWKGQIDKLTHHGRIWSQLDDQEKQAFAKGARHTVAHVSEVLRKASHAKVMTGRAAYGWAAHNLFDAVGIGLFDLGRVGRAGAKI